MARVICHCKEENNRSCKSISQ